MDESLVESVFDDGEDSDAFSPEPVAVNCSIAYLCLRFCEQTDILAHRKSSLSQRLQSHQKLQ